LISAVTVSWLFGWLQPTDELSPFFSTTQPYYPASYYFNYGQSARSTAPDNGHPAWKGAQQGPSMYSEILLS